MNNHIMADPWLTQFVYELQNWMNQKRVSTAQLSRMVGISHTNFKALLGAHYEGLLRDEYVYKLSEFTGVELSSDITRQLAKKFDSDLVEEDQELELHEKYPHYYKDVSMLTSIDVYGVCALFEIDDTSGSIHHAIKKLLVSGQRGGGKSFAVDVKEALDTLQRWLNLNEQLNQTALDPSSVLDRVTINTSVDAHSFSSSDQQPLESKPDSLAFVEDFNEAHSDVLVNTDQQKFYEQMHKDFEEHGTQVKPIFDPRDPFKEGTQLNTFVYNPPITGWEQDTDDAEVHQ